MTEATEQRMNPDPSKAEAVFVQNEAMLIYGSDNTDTLKLASKFVDNLKQKYPEAYNLGIKWGNLRNEIEALIPDIQKFNEVLFETRATSMKLDMDIIEPTEIEIKGNWRIAVEQTRNDPRFRDINQDAWSKLSQYGIALMDLNKQMKNLRPRVGV